MRDGTADGSENINLTSKHVCAENAYIKWIFPGFSANITLTQLLYKAKNGLDFPLWYRVEKYLFICRIPISKIHASLDHKAIGFLFRRLRPPHANLLAFTRYHGKRLTWWAFVKLSAFRSRAAHSSPHFRRRREQSRHGCQKNCLRLKALYKFTPTETLLLKIKSNELSIH